MTAGDTPIRLNLDDNQQPAVLGSVTLTWLLLLLAFGGRLFCRRIIRMPLRVDDYLIVPAVGFATLESLVIIAYMVPNNLGKHIFAIPTEEREAKLRNLRLGIFVFQQSWALGILSVKASMLALYWRLFSGNHTVKYQICFWGTIISCWGIEYLAYCRPIQGLWDDRLKLRCTVDTAQVIFINGVINTITDAAMLLIPLPAIWSLKLETKQKSGLSCIFLVGLLCTGASITRLVYMKKDFHLTTTIPDVSWNLVWTTTWTALELNIAIICACLTQLRPLLAPHQHARALAMQSPFSTLPDITEPTPTNMTERNCTEGHICSGNAVGDAYLELASREEIENEAQELEIDECGLVKYKRNV